MACEKFFCMVAPGRVKVRDFDISASRLRLLFSAEIFSAASVFAGDNFVHFFRRFPTAIPKPQLDDGSNAAFEKLHVIGDKTVAKMF